MDLPKELRQQVAEYALTAQKPLYWIWDDTERGLGIRGTFSDLAGLTALCRVSRQLHGETSGIVWKNNTFAFEQDLTNVCNSQPLLYLLPGVDEVSDRRSLTFFIKHASPSIKNRIKSISIADYFTPENCKHVLSSLQELAQQLPNTELKITSKPWHSNRATHDHEAPIEGYMYIGRGFESLLPRAYGDRVSRTWAIYPEVLSNTLEQLEQHLTGEELETALSWIRNGL
jgi:hypothetical protein